MNRLDQVGLAVAVRALKQDGAGVEAQLFSRVVAEVGEVKLGNVDVAASQSQVYTRRFRHTTNGMVWSDFNGHVRVS